MMGLRYHAMCVLDSDCILIHGGRNFKAISGKDINSSTFLCHKTSDSETWSQIKSNILRFAHKLVVHEGQIVIFGGFETDQDHGAAQAKILFEAERH